MIVTLIANIFLFLQRQSSADKDASVVLSELDDDNGGEWFTFCLCREVWRNIFDDDDPFKVGRAVED